jgi:hypothetical protein
MTSIRSFIKKIIKKDEEITIVSGLPRSGTSMMMSALQAGGMPLLTDGLRQADPNNPKGYYEYEVVKKLPKGQTGWLLSAHGKAVKVISALLGYLPEDFEYRVIFMERDLDEILASQKHMLERSEKNEAEPIEDAQLRKDYQEHLESVKIWLNKQDWIKVLTISYNQVLCDPLAAFEEVDAFLAPTLDLDAMAQIVDPGLYREKN